MARVDPYRNCNFLVEIDGITQAGFSDCTGFGASTDPIEYREGGENMTVRFAVTNSAQSGHTGVAGPRIM